MYGKRCGKCGKHNHFKDVCRSARSSAVNAIEKEVVHKKKPGIEMVNINSVNFNSNHSRIIANLKTSFKKAAIMVPYKVDMGNDGNIMPFNIFTKLFPSTTTDQLVAARDATKLRAYNCTTITQLGRCKKEIKNNGKHKKCIFFVVPGNGEALLGMPNMELLNILLHRFTVVMDSKHVNECEKHYS